LPRFLFAQHNVEDCRKNSQRFQAATGSGGGFVAGDYLRELQDRGDGAERGGVESRKEKELLLGHGGCISLKKAKFFSFRKIVVPARKITLNRFISKPQK
jgi:hypothetical protein